MQQQFVEVALYDTSSSTIPVIPVILVYDCI